MGMYTGFDGEITLSHSSVAKYIKYQIELGYDDADYPFGHFWGDTKVKGNKLIIDSYERNYDEDVETALAMLIKIDPKATGVVLSTYSDGTIEDNPEIRERFILKDGKVFKSILKEVKCIYGKEKEYDVDFDEDDIEQIKKNLERCSILEVCEDCKGEIILEDFDFSKRKYYEKIKEKTGIKNLCKKCYTKRKKPYAEEERLKEEYEDKLSKLEEQKGKKNEE